MVGIKAAVLYCEAEPSSVASFDDKWLRARGEISMNMYEKVMVLERQGKGKGSNRSILLIRVEVMLTIIVRSLPLLPRLSCEINRVLGLK